MKIGILTFHRSFNYGAFMQCFSLVQKLKKDFPECSIEVVDYTVKKCLDGYNNALSNQRNIKTRKKLEERNQCFTEVWNKLPLSDYSEISDEFNNTIEHMNKNYDVVIVGSDAVWNWIARGFPNLYFLKDYKGIKMSYAASAHGMNYQNMTEEQKQYLDEALSQFKYIGVRDITTEAMVKYINENIEVHHNCDPTAFLNLDDVPCDMEKLKEKLQQKGVDFSKPIIGLMASNSVGREIRKQWKGKAQIIALYEPNKYADVFLNDLTPFEWAKVFSLFKVTVTHFFHGTMLSLKNGVPVIPIEFVNSFSAVNKTKIYDVMNRLDLLEWRHEADYRSFSLTRRAMKKFGFWSDSQLWDDVNQHIADFLTNDYSKTIQERIEKESLNYNSFKESLKMLIKEEK